MASHCHNNIYIFVLGDGRLAEKEKKSTEVLELLILSFLNYYIPYFQTILIFATISFLNVKINRN